MSQKPATFAARLQSLRLKAGLSVYALAQQSGLSRQTLSQLESGRSQPSWETVRKLAAALGVETDAFRPESSA
jgi:transcriptional regulator with XRE-family HTH domain